MPDTTPFPTLTLAEMQQRYDGEWVVVINPVQDDDLEVLSGQVIAHSPDRDEMHQQVREYQRTTPFTRSASLCFAPVPDGMSILL